MKNLFKIFVLSLLVFAVGCENEDDPRFQDNPETGWVQFPSASTTVNLTADITNIDVFIDFTAPINLSDLNVSYDVDVIQGVPSAVVDGLSTSIVVAGNTNRAILSMTPTAEAITWLFENDVVEFDINLTSANRGINIGLADNSAITSHKVTINCGGSPPPGDYVIEMHDSWGDGWQTNDPFGGSGMTCTLTDSSGGESVIEFGMCSSFGTPPTGFLAGGLCVDGDGFDATAVVQIPAGTVSAVWSFPGDFFNEISFEIYRPNGDAMYVSGGPGAQAAEDLTVAYCQ